MREVKEGRSVGLSGPLLVPNNNNNNNNSLYTPQHRKFAKYALDWQKRMLFLPAIYHLKPYWAELMSFEQYPTVC